MPTIDANTLKDTIRALQAHGEHARAMELLGLLPKAEPTPQADRKAHESIAADVARTERWEKLREMIRTWASAGADVRLDRDDVRDLNYMLNVMGNASAKTRAALAATSNILGKLGFEYDSDGDVWRDPQGSRVRPNDPPSAWGVGSDFVMREGMLGSDPVSFLIGPATGPLVVHHPSAPEGIRKMCLHWRPVTKVPEWARQLGALPSIEDRMGSAEKNLAGHERDIGVLVERIKALENRVTGGQPADIPKADARKETDIQPGDLVYYPPESRQVMRSECQQYSAAVLVSLNPPVMVSTEGDMLWREFNPAFLRSKGTAPAEVLVAVMDRLHREIRDVLGCRDKGVNLILHERRRQIDVEKYTSSHDDEHAQGQLELAAICYAYPEDMRPKGVPPTGWPWAAHHWKPSPNDRVRELTKAGALIAAAIDRELRNQTP